MSDPNDFQERRLPQPSKELPTYGEMLGILSAGLVAEFTTAVITGYTVNVLWGWSLTELYGVARPGLWGAVLIALLISVTTSSSTFQHVLDVRKEIMEEEEMEHLWKVVQKGLIHTTGLCFTAFMVGYIAHLCLT